MPTASVIEPDARARAVAWIQRFLTPQLIRHFGAKRPLSCLQIAPDDPFEAEELDRMGHRCAMIDAPSDALLPFEDCAFDVVFTGRFPLLASIEKRADLAREIRRVIKPGGALLVVFGNGACPLDLSRNGPLLHKLNSPETLSVTEARRLFLDTAGFSDVRFLEVAGHFGWDRVPAVMRPVGWLLNLHWRFLATPARPWVYSSALNPTLILWLTRE